MIIIYAFDEKEGMVGANLFFEKGFDNIYLLSGGIEKFGVCHPESIEGSLPENFK